MSQDFHHQGIYTFSNGAYERSGAEANQISRDKVRLQGFDDHPPPPLVGIEEDQESGNLHHVYETVGMLPEMFNFPPQASGPGELLDYRPPRPPPPTTGDWSSSNRQDFNLESAMHLFLMNPHPRSPSPGPPTPVAASGGANPSTLHMLLPNPSTTIQGFNVNNFGTTTSTPSSSQQFTWVGHGTNINPSETLSLSLSSSLQQMEVAKAEELRMGDLYYTNQPIGGGGGGPSNSYKNFHVGFGSSLGMVNVLKNSKYAKPAQDLLEEFCSVGRGHHQIKNNKLSGRQAIQNNNNSDAGDEGKKNLPSLSASDRIEHQRRKVKLLSMLDEACNSLSLSIS
ncbi:hypothetical protein ACFE04_001928 [Oxalis oulophora]